MAVLRRGLIGGAAVTALLGTMAIAHDPVAAAPGSAVPVTTLTSNEQMPKWSPDGSRLAFWSDRDGTGPLASTRRRPTAPGRCAWWRPTTYSVRDFSWSPDGTKLAFVAGRVGDEGCVSLYVVDASGSGQPQVVHRGVRDGQLRRRQPDLGEQRHHRLCVEPGGRRRPVPRRPLGSGATAADGAGQRAVPGGLARRHARRVCESGWLHGGGGALGAADRRRFAAPRDRLHQHGRVRPGLGARQRSPRQRRSPTSRTTRRASPTCMWPTPPVHPAASIAPRRRRATRSRRPGAADSARLVFGSDRTGVFELYSVAADGTGPTTTLTRGVGHDQNPAVSPDGATRGVRLQPGVQLDVFVIPVTGESTAAGRPPSPRRAAMGRANLFARALARRSRCRRSWPATAGCRCPAWSR